MACVSPVESRQFRRDYDLGLSITQIAVARERSVETVHRWLQLSGSTRSCVEGVELRVRRGYKLNPNPYRIWQFDEGLFERKLTPESAWLLGLVYADGNVNGQSRLLLACGRDKDVAQKVVRLLGHGKSPKKERNCWMVEVSSARLLRSLVALGVTPAKTFTMQFPDVPESVLSHFTRGAWEGDGTMYLQRDGTPFMRYVSASGSFVSMVRDVVTAFAWPRPAKVGFTDRFNGSFSVAYRGRAALALSHWLYSDTKPWMRSDRKVSIYTRFGRV